MAGRGGAFGRLYRGETAFDFAGRWRRWFALSGAVIVVGLVSLAVQGLNFSIDFRGGTIWQVPSSASVSTVRAAVSAADPALSGATVTVLTNHLTNQRTVQVEGSSKAATSQRQIREVSLALAKVSRASSNNVNVNAIGPSWGSNVTSDAIKAVVIFLVAVAIYIWLRFEGKMAVAALVALVHDILVTVGIYSLSGFQVSPDTVIAFLTILGYSLYDTIVVFDKVQENTRSVASSSRLTYSETVNLSMNEVLARSLNTSFVAIIPILSILVIGAGLLGATTLNDFGLALFIGLTTGAYSSIFIASPLLALLKEREPRYAAIRQRRGGASVRNLTPLEAARGRAASGTGSARSGAPRPAGAGDRATGTPAAGAGSSPLAAASGPVLAEVRSGADGADAVSGGPNGGEPADVHGPEQTARSGPSPLRVPPRTGTRPPPRPRKKKGGRR